MSEIRAAEHSHGVRVTSQAWEIEHSAAAGGAWTSIRIKSGSGRNLLRSPVTSALRFVQPDPHVDAGVFTAFSEKNEKAPSLRVETTPAGVPVVVAEGTYRDNAGNAIPVGYRRRTEYHDYGLIWTTLEIMSQAGCDGVVEVRAMDLTLRAGLTDCFVRFHPTQAGAPDLLGGRAWYDLARQGHSTAFLSRYTPLQVLCRERGVEGIDLFPASELAQWDCAFGPDIGLGQYRVVHGADGTVVELNPYCMALRRMGVRVQGTRALRLGIALPAPKAGARTRERLRDVCIAGRCCSDEELGRLAQRGITLIRFQDSYREDGPFWKHGAYPPYDEAGMRELSRTIDAAHSHGLKIVPCVSLRELHPDVAAYGTQADRWRHMAAPSLGVIHNWVGTGETGGLMCLKSGWLDACKHLADAVLSGLPWDGLYLDAVASHPCCHLEHGREPFHTDMDELLHILSYCRTRVGENGLLVVRAPGAPSIFVENIADYIVPDEHHPA
ncbi:MAG: hypothetical protein NTW87_17260 [Planctomycetota bacterium]|nr:hypothetical protein [Planctomycetota bacterium]